MANKIQIRRSQTNSTVTGLANGELAYTANGAGSVVANQGLLYIGGPDGAAVIPIGGKLNFGTLTACSILAANATSYLDRVLTANLNVNIINVPTQGNGTAGQILTSNGTSNIYWSSAGGGGTVTNVYTTSGGIITSPAAGISTTGTVNINLASSPGLNTSSGLTVYVGNGFALNSTGLQVTQAASIAVAAGGISVNLGSNPGLSTTSGLVVSPGATIATGATLTVNLAATPGLVGTSGLAVKPDTAISVGASGTQVNLAATPGLITTSGLAVKPDTGISVGAGGTQVNLAATSGLSTTSGLTVTVNTSQLVVSSGGLTHNSTGNVTLGDLYLGGNLTVSGAVVTINTATLAVNDNLISLAYNQAGTTTFSDLCDAGFYVTTGNTATAYYSGLARIKNSSTNTNPYFQLFSYTGTAPNSTVLPAVTTGTLQSFLAPWGAGGALVVNGTNIAVTANATINVAIIANNFSISGSTLAVSNIAAGTDGQVLNMSGTTVQWSGLDGGVF